MKVYRDNNYPGILTRAEIKTQIALGTLTVIDLYNIIEKYCTSKYYLSEDVLNFLEEYLGITIRNKNKFYLRNKKF
ncbi:MAG: hypothetical protein ACTSWX_13650 [Promethearchaeota archaeon]